MGILKLTMHTTEELLMTKTKKKKSEELPRLMLHFQPQKWQNNYAIDIDGGKEFDATHAVLDLSAEEIKGLKTDSYESDNLIPDEVIGDHDGPYYVSVDSQIEEFFAKLGYDVGELTQEQLDKVRSLYASDRRQEEAKWNGSGI